MNPLIRKYFFAAASVLCVFLGLRYLLPLVLPFVLGAGLALAAEPLVCWFCNRLQLRRSVASGISVSIALSFLALGIIVVSAVLLRQLRNLAGILPEVEETLQTGIAAAGNLIQNLAGHMPGELGSLLRRNSDSLISGSDGLISNLSSTVLRLASGVLSHIPGSALGLGAAVISSYMISGKLPKIRHFLQSKFSGQQFRSFRTALSRLKTGLLGWLKAQLKLSSVTFGLSLSGFLLLGISRAPLWALLVAFVDAFPILGTGTVLIPWSIFSFLQGDHLFSFGLLGIYGADALLRSVLEPRFLGKQLGLDPLVTLMAMYIGFRLWGIPGMILSPMLAVAAIQLLPPRAGA